jgi:hypothetical protein
MELPEPLESEATPPAEKEVFAKTLKTNCVQVVWTKELRDAGMLKKISAVELLEVYVDKLSG